MEWKSYIGSVAVNKDTVLEREANTAGSKLSVFIHAILVGLRLRKKKRFTYVNQEILNEAINEAYVKMREGLEGSYFKESPLLKELRKKDADL